MLVCQNFKTFFQVLGLHMDGLKVNRFQRTYHTGVMLDQDMRTLIIVRILQEGGDRVTGYIPRSF